VEYKAFSQHYDVPRETFGVLEHYCQLLREWNQSINLVSKNEELWHRHILDSCQLAPLLNHSPVVDLGSGGGLPGVVLAIVTPIEITLVESDRRKAIFLSHCARELKLEGLSIRRERAEQVDGRFSAVTARALAPVSTLLSYATPLLKADGSAFFLKGAKLEDEINKAKQKWSFEYFIHPSTITATGKIIEIKDIVKND